MLRDLNVEFEESPIALLNQYDKALAIKVCDFSSVIDRAFEARGVHILAQYIYELAVIYNNFYHNVKIMPEKDLAQKKSWLKLSKIVLSIFEVFADIIKIDIPERM